MAKSILIVFGNIDFTADNSKATVNEIEHAFIADESEDPNELAESYLHKYNSYIIPQYYEGEIEWK